MTVPPWLPPVAPYREPGPAPALAAVPGGRTAAHQGRTRMQTRAGGAPYRALSGSPLPPGPGTRRGPVYKDAYGLGQDGAIARRERHRRTAARAVESTAAPPPRWRDLRAALARDKAGAGGQALAVCWAGCMR
jgi:hypothetical protein